MVAGRLAVTVGEREAGEEEEGRGRSFHAKRGILHSWPADGSARPVLAKKKLCFYFFFIYFLILFLLLCNGFLVHWLGTNYCDASDWFSCQVWNCHSPATVELTLSKVSWTTTKLILKNQLNQSTFICTVLNRIQKASKRFEQPG